MSKPRLLDLFCGAGGATKGYQEAGFYVVGVDIEPQPHYCGDEFYQADALSVTPNGYNPKGMAWPPGYFDLIHASPPCQAYTVAQVIHDREHPDLVGPTRDLLEASGRPYVIENVPGAPLRRDLVLCGSMFGLETQHGRLRRHRLFELSYPGPVLVPPHQHDGKTISVFGHGGHVYHGVDDWREVMGIDWMTRDELAEAIPPAYTRFIGEQFLSLVKESK